MGIILQAYPFIERKLLTGESTTVQSALQEVLYNNNGSGNSGLKLSRLLALLNNAAGSVATQQGAVFVDIDTVPEDGISFQEGLQFMMGDDAGSLRSLLEPEVDSIVDVLTRQIFRQGVQEAIVALTPPRLPSIPFLGDILPPGPNLEEIPIPLPGSDGSSPSFVVTTFKDLTDAVAPKLSQDEEIFALGLSDAAQEFFGEDMGAFVRGESIFSAKSAEILLSSLRSGFIGKSDLLSDEAVQSVADASSVEAELKDAMNKLSSSERERLDGIVKELTKQSISRFMDRLSTIQ